MENLLENLNKQQLEAVRHTTGPLLIVAGAGTGKTTAITRRIAYLAEQGLAKPDEILALTFTEKAAGEMNERVDLLMPLGHYDTWISTFHGFCERILKNHGLDIGLSNDFKILEDVKQWILIYKNFDKFNLDYYRPLGNPSKFIDALIAHFSRCKDELITPEEYLKYAESLRLETDSPDKVKKKKASKHHPSPTPPIKGGEIADSLPLVGRAREGGTDEAEISRLEEVANGYHVYQKLLLDNNYLDFGDLINYTLQLFQKRPKILEYYHKKFKFVMVDEFQDTNFAQYQLVKLLSGNTDVIPSASEGSLKHQIQEIPRSDAFARNDKTKDQNLVVVGDDDQSIYKFRGASVSNILKFKKDFPKLKEITLVENYRSSQNILDLAYNFIQANNPDRLEMKLKIDKRLKSNIVQATGLPLQGQIEVLEGADLSEELNLVAKKILELKNTPTTPSADASTPRGTPNFPEENLGNPRPPRAGGELPSWNDFAILLRRNAAADELLPILSASGIPYTFVANRGLYKKQIILDLLAYLRLLDNFHESHYLYRVLTFPDFSLSHSELSSLLAFCRKRTLSLFEAMGNLEATAEMPAASQKKLTKLIELLRHHANLAKTASCAEIFVQIVKDIGIEKKVEEDTLENAENRELIEQFYKKIENFQQQETDRSLHNFLYNLSLEQEAGSEGQIKFDPNIGPESLKAMTVHSAKGLEFKYVFVINMVQQRFPTREKKEAIEIPDPLIKDILPEGDFHLQEERRLFYVAMTRAKTGLFLSWAKDYGGLRAKKPSQFLVETRLVPGERKSEATGKVVFTPPRLAGGGTGKPLKQTAIFEVLPSQFSYSQLNDFQNCPLKYKYQHYLKLPVAGSCYLSFGQTIHKVLEEYINFHKSNLELPQQDLFGKKNLIKLPEFKVLEQLYEKHWVDDWYKDKKQKEEYRVRGKQLLKNFYDSIAKMPFQPKYIEKFFKLKLGPYSFVGKIDRADGKNGGLEILDYKTGSPKSYDKKKDLDQLYIYQWAAQEFLKEKVIGLKYWFLQEDEFKSEPVADEQSIEKLKGNLLELMERIAETAKFNRFAEEHKKCKEHKCEFEYLD